MRHQLFASEASGPQKNLKMGLGGNFIICGYGERSRGREEESRGEEVKRRGGEE